MDTKAIMAGLKRVVVLFADGASTASVPTTRAAAALPNASQVEAPETPRPRFLRAMEQLQAKEQPMCQQEKRLLHSGWKDPQTHPWNGGSLSEACSDAQSWGWANNTRALGLQAPPPPHRPWVPYFVSSLVAKIQEDQWSLLTRHIDDHCDG